MSHASLSLILFLLYSCSCMVYFSLMTIKKNFTAILNIRRVDVCGCLCVSMTKMKISNVTQYVDLSNGVSSFKYIMCLGVGVWVNRNEYSSVLPPL